MAFAHLHVHTEYSLLDGCNKIKEYVARVKALGMDSAAITDHGVMYGVIDFYREAMAAGIKPILGCEVYVAPNSRFDKELTGGEDRYYHLVLLAENNTGYSNLMKIVSRGFTEGYYYRPRVDMEILNRYHEGIIALSACLAGEVQRDITKGLPLEARKAARKYEACFGKGNYFLELQDHGLPEQRRVNMELMKMSRELNIPLVATNDVHYTYASDADAHDILLCLQTNKKLTDQDRLRYEGGQYYVKSEEEMRQLFPYVPEALENTKRIADRCHVEIEFGVSKLPRFDVPEGYDSWTYLNKLCREGLAERYGDIHQPTGDGTGQTLEQRLDYELGVIHSMGFVDYFLIEWDFINFAKNHGIPVGPGRGSAAGSIVAYCLKITNIDPIHYQLLFERFLNPERVTMPDIDVDFCFERRQEVIDYVVRKYGSEKVVQIVTFGTLLAKGVIRDVARVMDLPYSFADPIAKMIPMEQNKVVSLNRALEMNPELHQLYEKDQQVKSLIDMCKRLEGLPRHTSMHAAGVVICPEAAENLVPLSRGSDGSITTQFTMTTLEELGLLKMDFLGLRTLTVIHDAVESIQKDTGELIDLEKIPYDDPKVFSYIGTGKTEGVFQIESDGMRTFMKRLCPNNLEELNDGISLYRPGPMQFIPKYLKGKEAPDLVTYPCPQLIPILKSTYGCMVYQEQVMQIVRDLGGYTMGRSDLVRRAMSKKKRSVMEKERVNFIYGNPQEHVPGCKSKGIDEKVAGQIFTEMMDFAEYAFNKSHGASYAVVTYQTAWLKYYYPKEFMAALLTSEIGNPKKVSEYILVCRNMGIKILPPDINEGEKGFSVTGDGIRYSLMAIKSIGEPVVEALVRERRARGCFTNLKDFITRLSEGEMNKKAIENLIKAGALDSLGGTRKQFMSVYVQIMDHIVKDKKSNMAGQISLFDIASGEDKEDFDVRMPDVGEYSKDMLLGFEKEVLGVYLSGHPMEESKEIWEKYKTKTSQDFVLDQEDGTFNVTDQSQVIIGGMITDKKIKYTKNDKVMAFLTVEDLLGSVEVVVFPRDYEKYSALLAEEAKIFVEGRASLEEDKDGKVLCERIVSFEDAAKTKNPFLKKYYPGRDYGEDPGNWEFGRSGNPGGQAQDFGRSGNSGGQAQDFGGNGNSNGGREQAGNGGGQKAGGSRLPSGLWIQFPDMETYRQAQERLLKELSESDGNDQVVIFLKDSKRIQILPPNRNVDANGELAARLMEIFGSENVRIRK